jgi:Spy/CpxP family protein refolding chaperone
MGTKSNLLAKCLMVGALTVFSLTLSAQRGQGQGQGRCCAGKSASVNAADKAEMQTERMAALLELSPDQQAKVKAINAKYAEESNNAKQKASAERAERQKRKQAEIDAVLTPEQRSKHAHMQGCGYGKGSSKK